MQIMDEIARCLRPSGRLVARLNSTEDVEFGATGHREIEPGLYLAEGVSKRFFDRSMVMRLFDENWSDIQVSERTTDRYSRTKRLWEVSALRSRT